MSRTSMLPILIAMAMVAFGCSGGSSPVMPDQPTADLTPQAASQIHPGSSKAVWGIWGVAVDTSTWEISVIPLRGAQYTVDVVTFLQPPVGKLGNLSIKVTNATDWFTEGLIDVDVTLRHPFPGLDMYTGFDVYGVFVVPGSTVGQYDADVNYTNGADEPILLNPDGYTRWMNPVEFPDTGTILDFTPGILGIGDIGLFTSTINAYKYFADGLEKDQDLGLYFSDPFNAGRRGLFSSTGTNTREYKLKFPMVGDVPQLVFQYAVVASWVEPDESLSGDPDVLDVPGDFAPSANADEAVFLGVTDNSTLYYVGGSGGGSIILDLELFDWGALLPGNDVPAEVYQIIVEGSPGVVPGGAVIYDQAALATNASPGFSIISSVFEVEIDNCTPISSDDVPLLITVESFSPEQFDPGSGKVANDDRLAGYFTYLAPVGDEIPSSFAVISPNGGETLWMALSHEITWNPGDSGVVDVAIEWSTDDFGSDIRTIVDSTENDGSFIWLPIPNVPTTTAKIRVRDVLGTESDESDDYFTIDWPVWLEFQDEVEVGPTTVTWSYVPYISKPWEEWSPALSQDLDGMVHICWHAEQPYEAREVGIRSMGGTSWSGEGGHFFTWGGPGYGLRGDYMKLAPAANNTTFVAVWHWHIYFSVDVDHYPNGHGEYNYPCLTPGNRIYSNCEIMADNSYVYMVSDGYYPGGDLPGIHSQRVPTPNWSWTPGPHNVLTNDGELSHSRSWTFQDGTLVLAYYTPAGQIKLLKQTDQAGDTWNDTEVIFDGTGYSACASPSICVDGSDRLFAVWTGRENGSGDYHLLVSVKATPTSSWTDPTIAAVSATEFEDQHISCSAELVSLPTGDDEYMVLVGYELDDIVYSQISPKDIWAFLPTQQVSADGDVTRDPDTLCLESPYTFDALFVWSVEVSGSNWDIKFRNGDFETP